MTTGRSRGARRFGRRPPPLTRFERRPMQAAVVAGAGLIVLSIAMLIVRDGTVGGAERTVFRLINDMPDDAVKAHANDPSTAIIALTHDPRIDAIGHVEANDCGCPHDDKDDGNAKKYTPNVRRLPRGGSRLWYKTSATT